MAKAPIQIWSPAEDELLTRLWDEGAPQPDVMAKFHGRSWRAIQRHAAYLGLTHALSPRRMWSLLLIVQAIEERGPLTVPELAKATGLTQETVGSRLSGAGKRGWLVPTKMPASKMGRKAYRWAIGALPEMRRPKVDKEKKPGVCHRTPVIVRRDPLVAALFGAV